MKRKKYMPERHRPQSHIIEGSEKAVLFIHGFVGGPDQFISMMDEFNKHGYSTASILLPGHAEGIRKFAKATRGEWQKYVDNEIARLYRFRKIIIVGQSLGGLLALNASLDHKEKIDRIILFATPLCTHVTNIRAVFKRLLIVSGLYGRNASIRYWSGLTVSLFSMLYPPCWFNVFKEPKKFMCDSKEKMGEVRIPVMMFHSIRDETTDYRSADMFDKGLINAPHERVTLEKSFHAWYTAEESKIIYEKMFDFLERDFNIFQD